MALHLVEHSNSAIGSTFDFTRLVVHLRNYHPIGDDRIDTRLKVGLSDGQTMPPFPQCDFLNPKPKSCDVLPRLSTLPYQRQFVLGGTGTLRGYPLYEFVGNHGFLFNLEYVHSLSHGIYVVPFVDVGQTWMDLDEIKDFYPKVNLGIGFQLGIFRLNFAKGLERNSEYRANFKWSRTF